MNRKQAIKYVLEQVRDDELVVTSTGLISREVCLQKDRCLNFYMMGSMGCALPIGIGLALHVKQIVHVISGDGAVLMGLGSMITANKLKLPNLRHYILDNNCHASTGGQPTASNYVNFEKLCTNTTVYEINNQGEVPPRIDLTPLEIQERFKNAIQIINN